MVFRFYEDEYYHLPICRGGGECNIMGGGGGGVVTLILNVVIFTIVWFINLSVTLHCVIICDYLIILMSILNESMKYYLLNCIPLGN